MGLRPHFLQIFMDYILTFFAVFALDLVYTYYLKCVAEDRRIMASVWSVACYLGASIAVINYTTNHWLLLPALAGAFCGTYAGMLFSRAKYTE